MPSWEVRPLPSLGIDEGPGGGSSLTKDVDILLDRSDVPRPVPLPLPWGWTISKSRAWACSWIATTLIRGEGSICFGPARRSGLTTRRPPRRSTGSEELAPGLWVIPLVDLVRIEASGQLGPGPRPFA